ncbi:4-hydroxy-4-methyl-2-oxoglutarate aldolase [Grifola frondosa]|uniref:4-hydroxy-4-methyl-2-oxoglutarate aldolase n=1 Tax=Grifola frondosa TaxID=5627 RepID=A0A1C7M0W4_GRIFR|nr:4-hydroxy-4-methyl-2-oxoglutarate aldolase [Grifola frondosa]
MVASSILRLQSVLRTMSSTAAAVHTRTLTSFSTCELSDALIKLGLPHGGHIPDIRMFSPANSSETRVCGPAYTVLMVLASDTAAPKLSAHFVDTAPQGSVIVIDAPPRSVSTSLSPSKPPLTLTEAKNAVWGGLMTAGAQSRGALGVIISGRCRDLAEHRAASFPVFARGNSTLGQSPFTRPSAVNVPLVIAPQGAAQDGSFPAVHIQPGDWMVADEDGIVCVPVDLVTKVVELAAKGREIDERCMQDIKAGKGVQETFKLHRGK